MVYAAIINTIVTVAMWTVGFVVMGKEGERISIRKVALNPGAVGVYIGLPLLLFSWSCRIRSNRWWAFWRI